MTGVGLTPGERTAVLAPCHCGHDINSHGTLVACWICPDENRDCPTTFEALLAERDEAIVAARCGKP